MKKLIISSVLLCASYSVMWSQTHVDLKIGVSPALSPLSIPIIVNRDNPRDEFLFSLTHVKPQFFGGISIHQSLGNPFFIEGGITYTKKTSQYRIFYTLDRSDPTPREMFMNETEDKILLPVNIGVGMGRFDITSGLTMLKTISSKNELTHLKGFNTEKNSLQCGWQMGARYAFKKVLAGIEYQGTMNRVCQGMSVNGNSLEIMNTQGRFVFSVQYRL